LPRQEDKVQSQANPPAASASRGLPFQVRGSLQTILSLRLLAPDDPDFYPLLLDKIAHSPDFFRAAPVVLDVGPLAEQEPIDLAAMILRLREQHLFPVGLQNGNAAWNKAASEAGLALFSPGSQPAQQAPERRPAASEKQAVAPAPQPLPRRGPAQLIAEPVRGGQQVVTSDGDLIVTATVGHGAEIEASGHVHVYGTLRGRAFAGIEGDTGAMIFCDQLEAELLSIAGVHIVNEEIDPKLLGRRVRVRLEREQLVIQQVG
jgi:septum site-determining protein MinC